MILTYLPMNLQLVTLLFEYDAMMDETTCATMKASMGNKGQTHLEEESVQMRNKDEGLRDDGDLEVDNHMEFTVVVVAGSGRSTTLEGNTELVIEPGGPDNDGDKCNTTKTMSAKEI